jgi:hypothetical protein
LDAPFLDGVPLDGAEDRILDDQANDDHGQQAGFARQGLPVDFRVLKCTNVLVHLMQVPCFPRAV